MRRVLGVMLTCLALGGALGSSASAHRQAPRAHIAIGCHTTFSHRRHGRRHHRRHHHHRRHRHHGRHHGARMTGIRCEAPLSSDLAHAA